MTRARVGVVGEVFLDLHADRESEYRRRTGGVVHASRALSAMGADFVCAAVLPEYLRDAVREECVALGGAYITVGAVSGSPNIAIYRDTLEAGDQRVVMPTMGPLHRCDLDLEAIGGFAARIDDALIIPGCYDWVQVARVLSEAGIRLHVDVAYDTDLDDLLGGPLLETAFVSTSSDLFLSRWAASPSAVWEELSVVARVVVLKESRGGSRVFLPGAVVSAPAFVGPTQHSVGVGDCFDAAHVFTADRGHQQRLELSSALAAAYAATWDQEQFAATAQDIILGKSALDTHATISLPWECRPNYSIYVAAPDFPLVDRGPLDRLVSALEYHNFLCRLPIRENGLADEDATGPELAAICDADLRLLGECSLLVAVLLYDDPGTLIEIGIAAERGLPVIVFDPYERANNLMLRCVPRCVSSSLSEVVTAVFEAVGEARTSA